MNSFLNFWFDFICIRITLDSKKSHKNIKKKKLPFLYFKLVSGSLDFKSIFVPFLLLFVEQVWNENPYHQTTELFPNAS